MFTVFPFTMSASQSMISSFFKKVSAEEYRLQLANDRKRSKDEREKDPAFFGPPKTIRKRGPGRPKKVRKVLDVIDVSECDAINPQNDGEKHATDQQESGFDDEKHEQSDCDGNQSDLADSGPAVKQKRKRHRKQYKDWLEHPNDFFEIVDAVKEHRSAYAAVKFLLNKYRQKPNSMAPKGRYVSQHPQMSMNPLRF
jgi:hypothetical protein